MAAPGVPTNLYVQQGNGQVFLSWDITAGATGYPVQRSLDGVTFSTVSTPVATSYLDTSVTVGTQYYYRVQASNADGTSSATSAQMVVPTLTGDLSLGQVRLMAQQRADRVNSNFVTTPEWNSYITQSYFELYDLLVTTYEDYYLASPYSITTDGSASTYALPANMYKLMGVDCGLSASQNAWVTVEKFDFINRNAYVYPTSGNTYAGVFNLRYRMAGNNLLFIPTPSAGQTIRVWFVPKLAQPLKDTDILSGISGWIEYVITDAALKALQKEESDVSVLAAQKQALKQRIEESAMNRDAGQPDTISNTRKWSGGGFGNSDGYGGY